MNKILMKIKSLLFPVLLPFLFMGCASNANSRELVKEYKEEDMRTLYLAGGCFWGVEKYFAQFEGVIDTEVGYANGPETELLSYRDNWTASCCGT